MRIASFLPFHDRAPSLETLALATRQLAVMMKAGIPLSKGLNAIARGAEGRFRQALQEVSWALQAGHRLSAALGQHHDLFSHQYVEMVSAGELTGNLPASLEELARYLERSVWLQQRVRGALMYPLMVLAASGLLVSLLLFVMIPTFVDLFSTFSGDLPLPTRILVGLTAFTRSPPVQGTLVGAAVLALLGAWRLPPGVLERLRAAIGRVPVIGQLQRYTDLIRCARVCSSLSKSGLPFRQVLTATIKLDLSPAIREALTRAAVEVVRNGSHLSKALQTEKVFPPLFVSMVQVGESTGSLAPVFDRLADLYEESLSQKLDTALALVEPLLLLGLGVVVGFLLLAAFLPMYELLGQLR